MLLCVDLHMGCFLYVDVHYGQPPQEGLQGSLFPGSWQGQCELAAVSTCSYQIV